MPLKLRPKQVTTIRKGIVRQNWSTLTLYNLAHLARQRTANRTFFQQKFKAMQDTRKYHGEHLTKRQWMNIFSRSLKSVVPMNTRDLALSDGSEHGAGRGAGLDGGAATAKKMPPVPYMNQTYAPMERRLDLAIFRAMFASSALQARQFVIHGFVKVNGRKMKYPQYMLNPGDMFSVDLDKVLFATGAPKGLPKSRDPRWIERRKGKEAGEGKEEVEEAGEGEEEVEEAEAKEGVQGGQAEGAAKGEGGAIKGAKTEATDAAKTKAEAATTLASEGVAKEQEKQEKQEKQEFNRAQEEEGGLEWWKDANRDKTFDATKPYRTPWRPRYFLSAFAFIPKYLEVNHNIGHAVYLRHPVARPGQSEVPTPFHADTMQLAHSWWLRRR